MSELLQMIQKFTIKHDRSIKRITAPLEESLAISYFTRYTIDHDGNFALLSNITEQNEFFFSEKLFLTSPYLVAPDLLRPGCTIDSCTPETHSLEVIKKRFGIRDFFIILQKKPGYMEGLLFGTRSGDLSNVNRFISNIELLKKFGQHFAQQCEPLFQKMAAQGYNLKKIKKEAFFQSDPSMPLTQNKKQFKRFLQTLSPLSAREHECLDLYREGFSAQATAEYLGLSHRTVEHYFENIKDKLGIFSKKELR